MSNFYIFCLIGESSLYFGEFKGARVLNYINIKTEMIFKDSLLSQRMIQGGGVGKNDRSPLSSVQSRWWFKDECMIYVS